MSQSPTVTPRNRKKEIRRAIQKLYVFCPESSDLRLGKGSFWDSKQERKVFSKGRHESEAPWDSPSFGVYLEGLCYVGVV